MQRKSIVAVLTLAIVAFCASTARAWIYVGAISPRITGGPVSQAQMDAIVAKALSDLYATELWKYQSQPKLGKGFANAAAYSAHAATQRGYQGYDKFAITIGAMAGAQLPSFDLDYYRNISKKLKYRGDINAGAALIPYSVQVGIKVSENWSIAPKFGMLNYSYSGYTVEGINAGLMVNYQIFKKEKAGFQVFVWRGVSIGTGLLYERYNVKMKHKMGKIYEDVTAGSKFMMEPQLKFNIRNEAYVVPLEVSTSIRLLWILNLCVGGGIDFTASKAVISAKGYSPSYVIDGSGTVQTSPGIVYAYGRQGGKMGQWYFPKLTAGVGMSFGPVVIDVPVTYYFVKGLGVGLSVGFEW